MKTIKAKRTNGSSFICNIDYTAINNILLINNQFISSIENGFRLESEPIIYNSCLESQIDIDVDNHLPKAFQKSHYSIQTSKDGNCFYRAISINLYGVEVYHTIIRLLCSNQLILKRTFFDEWTSKNYNTENIY